MEDAFHYYKECLADKKTCFGLVVCASKLRSLFLEMVNLSLILLCLSTLVVNQLSGWEKLQNIHQTLQTCSLTSIWPPAAAKCEAWLCLRSVALTSAPFCNKARTTFTLPLAAAAIRAVVPVFYRKKLKSLLLEDYLTKLDMSR